MNPEDLRAPAASAELILDRIGEIRVQLAVQASKLDRLDALEKRVAELEKFKAILVGAVVTAGIGGGASGSFVAFLMGA